ncbi:hypothetical protein ACU635_27495 [[Actinomadura] parvosata]
MVLAELRREPIVADTMDDLAAARTRIMAVLVVPLDGSGQWWILQLS